MLEVHASLVLPDMIAHMQIPNIGMDPVKLHMTQNVLIKAGLDEVDVTDLSGGSPHDELSSSSFEFRRHIFSLCLESY